MNFDSVEKIAAAILYEGYILYPYRKTAIKNRQRWNFGTLYPRIYAEAKRPQEPFQLICEVLLADHGDAMLDLRVSFLQLVRQQPGSGKEQSGAAGELSDPSLAWEEAVERTSDHSGLKINDLISSPVAIPLHLEGATLADERCAAPALDALLNVTAQSLPDGSTKLRIEFQNTSTPPGADEARRDQALPQSLVSAHIILGITGGEFISLLDPPLTHADAARACNNVGVFPVLAGDEPARNVMLLSPIILYDYPKIAPESEGDFFDGTEMDEMLTLRVLTLTDAEKEEMRSGDPRARRILERTESLTKESIIKAHGAIRGMRDIRVSQQELP